VTAWHTELATLHGRDVCTWLPSSTVTCNPTACHCTTLRLQHSALVCLPSDAACHDSHGASIKMTTAIIATICAACCCQ